MLGFECSSPGSGVSTNDKVVERRPNRVFQMSKIALKSVSGYSCQFASSSRRQSAIPIPCTLFTKSHLHLDELKFYILASFKAAHGTSTLQAPILDDPTYATRSKLEVSSPVQSVAHLIAQKLVPPSTYLSRAASLHRPPKCQIEMSNPGPHSVHASCSCQVSVTSDSWRLGGICAHEKIGRLHVALTFPRTYCFFHLLRCRSL
jgi:hypothetical protein